MINLATCEIWICIWKYYLRSRKLDVQTWSSSRKYTALLVWTAMFLFERYKSPCLRLGGSIVLLLCLLDVREIKRQSLFGNHALLYLETKGALSESIQNVFFWPISTIFCSNSSLVILTKAGYGAQVFMDDYRHRNPQPPCCSHWWAGLTAWRDEKMRRRKFTIIKQISHSPYIRSCVYHSIYMCLLLIVLLGMVMSQSW